jgi:hypothetical protein
MKTVWKATSEDIIDHLVGAGAGSYDWYRQLHETGGAIVCQMETGENDDATGEPLLVKLTFSPTHALNVVNDIIKEQRAGWHVVLVAVDSDDFDADASDVVLQHIVLGALVFG